MSITKIRLPAKAARLTFGALAALASAGMAFGQAALVGRSPFTPAGGASGGAGAPAEAYELAGSTVQGGDVSVCIFEREANHSRWIPVGGITDGIHVISFDAAHDTAMVNVGGALKELTMRKATVAPLGRSSMAVATPPVAPPTVADAAVASPSGQNLAKEQREARMLVSDLLEIGVQQRKAYQEAKRKAASDPTAQPPN